MKMMKRKKVARNMFSNVGILGLLAVLHRMVFAVLSRSSENRNSVVFVFVADHHHWIPGRWCFRTGFAGARLRWS